MPIGPNNRIEPGGPDMGQPTHFLPGRQTGIFVITVPKEFTPQQRLTWTIIVNGQTTAIPLRLNPDYIVSPFKDSRSATRRRCSASRGRPVDPGASAARSPRRSRARRRWPRRSNCRVWADDDAKYTSDTNAPMRGSAAAGDAALVEVPRARRGDVRQSAPDAREAQRRRRERAVQGKGHDDGEVQRTGRLRAARDRERLLRRRRRRVRLLLDDRAGQGNGHAVT